MPATNSAIEATKRNRAMMHKPQLYDTMKRYHSENGVAIGGFHNMTKEEQLIFEEKMKAAKKKSQLKELSFYSILILGIIAFLLFILF